LDGFLALQQRLGFRTTLLHVVTSGDETVSFPGSKLEAQLTGIQISYAEISVAGEVDQAIASFPDSHDVDWLALAPHQYGFWSGLFHKSHTSKVLNLSHVPVLGLH
jgi:nucleotide-binding universal stress UspA family protein